MNGFFKAAMQELLVEFAGSEWGNKEKIAKLSGIPKTTMIRCLNGEVPKSEHLIALQNKFGVSIDWLLTGKEPKYINESLPQEAVFPLAQELNQWWQDQNYSTSPERKSWFKCQLLDSFPSFANWLKKRTESTDIDNQPAPEQVIALGQAPQTGQEIMIEGK